MFGAVVFFRYSGFATGAKRPILLELILKLEIALSNVEESGYSRGFRTGSKSISIVT